MTMVMMQQHQTVTHHIHTNCVFYFYFLAISNGVWMNFKWMCYIGQNENLWQERGRKTQKIIFSPSKITSGILCSNLFILYRENIIKKLLFSINARTRAHKPFISLNTIRTCSIVVVIKLPLVLYFVHTRHILRWFWNLWVSICKCRFYIFLIFLVYYLVDVSFSLDSMRCID